MGEPQLVTAPTTTPISLVEACNHLRESEGDNTDDVLLKLKAAIDFCQRRVSGGRQFCAATYDYLLRDFPSDGDECRLTLPMPPLSKVQWIKYYDTTGVLTTLGTTNGSTGSTGYYITVAPQDTPGYVVPAYNQSWPSVRDRPDAVRVRFVAGSTSTSAVNSAIKAAVLLKLEHLYDPDRVDEGAITKAIDDLLSCMNYGNY